ncbi:MAG: hypothetical protein ACN4GR_13130 [Arenicellales bacterium]
MTNSNKKKTTPKRSRIVNKKSVSVKAKTNTSTKKKDSANTIQSKKQSTKDLLSKQEKDVPDLNTSTGYPLHPNRIWPD